MTGSSFRSICIPLLAALIVLAGRCGQAQEHPKPEHPAPAAATPAEMDHAAHGGVDYNQPPLPGKAPGLGTLFIFSLLLFVGFLFVARAVIWRPLIQALDERETRINLAHSEAERANAEAARLLALHQAQMNKLEEQVKGIVAKARQQADVEKAEIIAAAEADAKALRDRALDDIRKAREEATTGLAATVERQVGLAAEHILGHRLN